MRLIWKEYMKAALSFIKITPFPLFACLILFLLISCGEKQNYLSGDIEGLEPGDRIVLALIDPITDEIYISDSTIVEKKNHFDLHTKATDQWAYLAHWPQREKRKIEHHRGNRYRFFLERYASLHLSGSTDNFQYLNTTGGLYETPDLREAFKLRDSALLIQQDGIGRPSYDPLRRELIKQSNRMLMAVDSMEQQFANTHPDFAYSAAIMRYVDEKELEKRFQRLTPRVQKSVAGVEISNHLQRFRSTQPGGIAPDFTLLSRTGNSIRLSDYRGKHVFLEFWGSWCGVCRMMSPRLIAFNRALPSDSSVVITGIACDEASKENWEKAVEEDNLNWIQVIEENKPGKLSVSRQYAIDGYPTSLLIDPKGRIVLRGHPNEILKKASVHLGLSTQ